MLPEFRGRGIARRLMQTFVDESVRMGKERILLLCKQGLIAYYERLGFSYAGPSSSAHGGAPWHEMRYDLT